MAFIVTIYKPGDPGKVTEYEPSGGGPERGWSMPVSEGKYVKQLNNLRIHVGWREYLTAPGVWIRL